MKTTLTWRIFERHF